MTSFEEERLRILERVSAGELTPQEGQLQIAMAKVRQGDAGGGDADAEAPRARTTGPLPRPPSKAALFALLAVPFLVMGALLTVGLSFFLALPAYLVMWSWNHLVVPGVPGAAEIGFFQTLGVMVFASLVSTGLRWRRRVKVFMAGGAQGTPFGFQAGWTGGDAPAGPGLRSGDPFREQ